MKTDLADCGGQTFHISILDSKTTFKQLNCKTQQIVTMTMRVFLTPASSE